MFHAQEQSSHFAVSIPWKRGIVAGVIARLCVLVLGSIIACAHADTVLVESDDDLARAATLAADTHGRGVLKIEVAGREFVLTDTFRILRSDVRLQGSPGTRLVLADGVEKPVIAVGVQNEVPLEEQRIRRIRISSLEIDGNKIGQGSETGADQPWIRNNGIDVRMTSDLVVDRVTSNRSRSGGLVISWKSRDIVVRDSSFDDNFFDGVAYYDSRNVRTIDCSMAGNDSAGISLDNDFADSEFTRCRLVRNGDVGIFARHCSRLRFDRCTIEESGDWGAFLAHDDSGLGVHSIRFTKCIFSRNDGGIRMASVSETQSSDVEVRSCVFRDNGPRPDVDSAGSRVQVVPSR